MNETEKPLVGLYVRVSTQEQAKDGYSIDEQKDRLTKYAEAQDWIIYNIYSDPGFSGAKLDRPAIQTLINDVENHKMNKVLVYKLDRLSRSQKDTLYLIEDVFLKNDIDFVSMTENFDTATAFGKAMVGMLSVFAQLEREQIKDRTMSGREGRAKTGLWSGNGRPPTGYRYEEGRLIVEPYEAEIVRRIYREYLSGKTIGSIVRDLNAEGVKSKYGPFTRTTVHDILNNSTYAGIVHFGGQTYDGQHEAIVTREDSDRAIDMLKDAADKDKNHLGFTNRTCLITGLCYCGECGQKMVSRYWRKKDGTLVKNLTCKDKGKTGCKSKAYRRDDVEKAVLSQVRKLRLDSKMLKRNRTKNTNQKIEQTIKTYEDKIESNRQKISRYMDLYAIGGIDMSDLNNKIAETSRENENLTLEISKLKNKKDYVRTDDDIKDDVVRLDEYLDESNIEQARRILVTLIKKVVIKDDKITIYWNF